MVVGDDDVNSGATKSGDWTHGPGAAIAGHEDLRSGGQSCVHPGVTQIVAVFDAPRNERSRLPAQTANYASENRCRTDTVYVVIAVDEDQFLFADGARQALHRLVHRKEAQRIVEPLQFRPEEALGLIGGGVAANQQ